MVQADTTYQVEETVMIPKIVKRSAFTIVGFQFEASLLEVEQLNPVHSYFNELILNKDLIQSRLSDEVLVVQSYPLKDNFNPKKDRFKHVIGYRVQRALELPDNMISLTIPSCDYIKVRHTGSSATSHEVHDYLYSYCEQQKDFSPLGFDIEEWRTDYNPFQATNEIDVLVAVR